MNAMNHPPLRGVYFIQGGEGSPIKIGYASDCYLRLNNLQSATPVTLRILTSAPGTKEAERALHAKFAKQALGREWFTPTPDIFAEIEKIKADPGYLMAAYTNRAARIKKSSEGVESNALHQLEIECAEEARKIVLGLAEPRVAGDNIRECVARAAAACGMPHNRVRRIWYGFKITLHAHEYVALHQALQRRSTAAAA